MADLVKSWTPSPTLNKHSGEPLASDADFFVPPPEVIGEIRSAHTTLVASKQPYSTNVILASAAGGALAGAALGVAGDHPSARVALQRHRAAAISRPARHLVAEGSPGNDLYPGWAPPMPSACW